MVGIREKERGKETERPEETKAENFIFPPFFFTTIIEERGLRFQESFQEVSHISFLYKCIPSNFHLEGTCRLRRLRWVERFVPAEWSGVIAVSHGRRLTRVQQMCFLSYTEQTGGFMGFWPLGHFSRNFFQKISKGFVFRYAS